MKIYYWYIVEYGDHTGEHKSPNWADACDYMQYCLREGYRIRGVRRVARGPSDYAAAA